MFTKHLITIPCHQNHTLQIYSQMISIFQYKLSIIIKYVLCKIWIISIYNESMVLNNEKIKYIVIINQNLNNIFTIPHKLYQ